MKRRISSKPVLAFAVFLCFSFAATFSVAQDRSQDTGVVTFSCLKYDNEQTGQASSDIALLERSSAKIPLPELKETCSSYIARLSTASIARSIERGGPSNLQNSVQVQPAGCGLVPQLLPPSQHRKYYQCLFIQIHWIF